MANTQSAEASTTDEKPFISLEALPEPSINQIGSGLYQPPEIGPVKVAHELDIPGHFELIKDELQGSASANSTTVSDSTALAPIQDQKYSEIVENQRYGLNSQTYSHDLVHSNLICSLTDLYMLIVKSTTVAMRQIQSRTSPTKT